MESDRHGPVETQEHLTAAVASVAAIGVPAQQRSRPVVALLSGARQSDNLPVVEALVAELRALGHVDGQTIEFDARYADYSPVQGQRLAAEIAARKPAVIVANGPGIELAFRLSPPLRVVFIHSGRKTPPAACAGRASRRRARREPPGAPARAAASRAGAAGARRAEAARARRRCD